MLDDGLRFRRGMPEIGETRSVDAGWQPASPASPHQSADIEQNGRVVSHSIKLDDRKEGPAIPTSLAFVNGIPIVKPMFERQCARARKVAWLAVGRAPRY